MSLNDFILKCEEENKQLRKDIVYYKNYEQRLEQENKRYKEAIDKAIKYIKDNEISLSEQQVYYYEKDIKLINIPSDDILNILKEVE